MVIEDALKKILSDSAEVRSLVGTRVHNGVLPQKLATTDYPCIVFRKVDEDREPTLGSASTEPPNAEFVFFAVTRGVFADKSAQRMASTVDKTLRGAIHGYKDVVIVDTLSPPEMMDVQGIFFRRAAHTYDDKTETHQYASVYDVRYSDSD